MEKKFNAKDMWNKASGAAIVLGAIPVAVSFLSFLLGKWTGTSMFANVTKGFAAFVLWAAKFVGCICVMRYFMDSFRKSFSGVTRADLFRFGSIMALFSALIAAAFELIDVTYLEPGKIDMLKEMFNSPLYAKLDSNSLEMLDKMTDNLPQITFISQFIYCTIYGVLLSLILSSRLISSNPFDKDADSEDL